MTRVIDVFSGAGGLSEGNVRRHTLDRMESLTLGTAGKRLAYKDLIQ